MDNKYNQMVIRYEKNELFFQQRINHLDSEKRNLSVMMKLYEEEKKQFKDKENLEFELHSKIGELNFRVERQKDDHKKELDKLHYDYNIIIINLKKIFDTV